MTVWHWTETGVLKADHETPGGHRRFRFGDLPAQVVSVRYKLHNDAGGNGGFDHA